MTSDEQVLALARSFVDECEEDFVGVWAIVWEVKQRFPALDADQTKATTLEIVRHMLATREVCVGDFDREKRFLVWSNITSDDAVLAELDRRWTLLGREPDIGDVAWFTRHGSQS